MASSELLTVLLRNNRQIKVMMAGEGKPVIFLHGAGVPTWTAYLEELAKNYQVFAPCFPGVGGSSTSEELGLQDWWDLILYYYDLFDALGLDSVDLIGHSFGGMLAAQLASTDNRRFEHLILICAAGLWDERWPVKNPGSIPQEQLAKLMFYDHKTELARELTELPQNAQLRAQIILERQNLLNEIRKYTREKKDIHKRIRRIRAKTCIVWGRHDGLIPMEYAYEFQKNISGSLVRIIEHAAHFPHLEQLHEVLGITVSVLEDDYVANLDMS